MVEDQVMEPPRRSNEIETEGCLMCPIKCPLTEWSINCFRKPKLEDVINKQETHHLVCPNCEACITGRVILIPKETPSQPTEERECSSCFNVFVLIGRDFYLKCISGDDRRVAPADVQHENENGGVVIRQEQITTIIRPEVSPEQASKPGEIQETMDDDVRDKLPFGFVHTLPVREEKQNEGKKVQQHPDPALPSTSKGQLGQVVVSKQKQSDQTTVTIEEIEPLFQRENNNDEEAAPMLKSDRVDFIKSVVYGGLLESIASLGVVASAAGAGAKTLNIVALGLANMIGGLFVLAHSLRVMKDEHSKERYEEVLGQGPFTFHFFFAILSYLVFGLMPPLVYGFTFYESNNRNCKLILVASVSLVCIALLALGKAHTHSKDYIKKLTYYVSLWAMACGVSYLAGELLVFLLDKFSWFDFSSSPSPPPPQHMWVSSLHEHPL